MANRDKVAQWLVEMDKCFSSEYMYEWPELEIKQIVNSLGAIEMFYDSFTEI